MVIIVFVRYSCCALMLHNLSHFMIIISLTCTKIALTRSTLFDPKCSNLAAGIPTDARRDIKLSSRPLSRDKQLQEFFKSDHWLRRYCILSGGVFHFEQPCTLHKTNTKTSTNYKNNEKQHTSVTTKITEIIKIKIIKS